LLSPLAAWRVSLQRMRADWPMVAAAWLVTLLAATLLAAGPIYSDAVSLAGLHRVLADAPVDAANIEVTAALPRDEAAARSRNVERLLADTVGGIGADIQRSARSDSYALPDQPDEVRDLAVFGFADGIELHASLVDGAWPESGVSGDAVQVAIIAPMAETLGWNVGDFYRLTSRRDETQVVGVQVAGIYDATDAQDPFWWSDEQALAGFTESDRFRTFGPLITATDDLLAIGPGGEARFTWHAILHRDELELAEVGALRARVRALPERISFELAGTFPAVSTDLDEILGVAQRSLLVSRTGVLLLIVQLAILAAYAIVLTAGLLVDHRRGGTALLRSRGAGPFQVALMALVEAVVLALPAALLAPWLAAGALRLLNVAGPLASTELGIEPLISETAYLAAAGAALGCALLLVIPAFIAARSFVDEEGARSRFETRTIGQRLGIDFALLAVTVIGFWQLRLYGAPLTRSVQGTLGLDPLLVAAPAIGLLAGGVLALRMVPLLAAAAEMLTRRGRRLIASLGAQQVARRPLRYTRAALLLMLAVSMGVFAISYSTTWQTSQADQASYQVGSDVRVEAALGVGNVPAWGMRSALDAISGVAAAMPLERQTVQVSRAAGSAELIGLLPEAAGDVVDMRADLSTQPLTDLFAPLAEARPIPQLVTLEGIPQRLRVDADVVITGLTGIRFDPVAGAFIVEQLDLSELDGLPVVGAEVAIRDGAGLIQRFVAGAVPLADGAEQIEIPLSPTSDRTVAALAAAGGTFTGPLQVVGIDVSVRLPESWRAIGGHIGIEGVMASDEAAGGGWQPVGLDAAGAWNLSLAGNQGPRVPITQDLVLEGALVLGSPGPAGQINGVPSFQRAPTVSFVPASIDEAASDFVVPIVVNQAFLDGTATVVGDEVTLRLDTSVRQLLVTGVVRSFPTLDPDRPAVIADLSTLALLRFEATNGFNSPDEWWLATDPGREADVTAAVSSGPFADNRVTSTERRTQSLSADPVALGIIGALSLGFVVAGLFAVIGLAVSAAVSARQRRTEFALLRALGLSSRQLSGWLWLENSAVVIVSLATGTALGLVIGWVVLPFITVTQQAAAPFPPPLVRVPWDAIGLLLLLSSVAMGLTVLLLARLLRRIGIGSVLRMGED
jgi:hypothetical protein